MSKFRSYFATDLDSLKSSITNLLAESAESNVDILSFESFCVRLQLVYDLVNNRDFSDLIRKK